MTYEQFIKKYYRLAVDKLNENHFSCEYFIVDVNYMIDFEEQYYIKLSEIPECQSLPPYKLKESAPLEKYEEFFDYYRIVRPGFKNIFLSKQEFKELYDKLSDALINAGDEAFVKVVGILLDISIKNVMNIF